MQLKFCALAVFFCFSGLCQTPIGQFEAQGDIGTLLHPGSATFDAATGSYSVTASGENMWAKEDDYHFVWKKFSGDVSLTADIAFPTKTGNPHKKAALMIRQSLDADSPYVDAALHVVGLTSLQWRAEKGGATHEVGTDAATAPTRMRLVKRGDDFYLYYALQGEDLRFAGGSVRLALKEPFYIGLGVCAHDKDAQETAVFSKVGIEAPPQGKMKLYSTLETISVSSTDRRVVAVFDGRIEKASWTADGTTLLFAKGKQEEQIPAAGGKMESAGRGEREMAPSDKQRLAALSYSGKKPKETTLSVKTLTDGKMKVLATILGGAGTLSQAPWSPDGKRLVFVSYQFLP